MTLEAITDTPERVLAIYAQPDDSDVSCGGTLARWANEGSEVHSVVCATGDKGSADPATDVSKLIATRQRRDTVARGSLNNLCDVDEQQYRVRIGLDHGHCWRHDGEVELAQAVTPCGPLVCVVPHLHPAGCAGLLKLLCSCS